MVRATYTAENNTHTLIATGHANYAEYGKDIVCAGVSSLIQALMGWIEENHHRADNINVERLGEEIVISCEGGDDIAAVFQVVTMGLVQIADSYPNHVQINIIGTAD